MHYNYTYDNNGNMLTRKNDYQSIVWDAENRPVSITTNGTVTTFVYDGDGNRVRKTVDGGEDILYINTYYEENLTTGNATLSYYLSGRLIAQKEGTEIRYMHQDHLSGTSLMTSWNGTSLGMMKYYPYGSTRSGEVPTDIQFTGQRYDDTGLYYYNARYYDPEIGRFISPDTIIPSPPDPQSFNRYTYCLNNPLKYVDPSGYLSEDDLLSLGITKENTNTSTYELLREAKHGDQLIIDQSDGTIKKYTLTDWSVTDFYTPSSDIRLADNTGTEYNVRDIVDNENNQLITLCEKRKTIDPIYKTIDEQYYVDTVVNPITNTISSPSESRLYQSKNYLSSISSSQALGMTEIIVGLAVLGFAAYMIFTGPIGPATLGWITATEIGWAMADVGVNDASDGQEDLVDIPFGVPSW